MTTEPVAQPATGQAANNGSPVVVADMTHSIAVAFQEIMELLRTGPVSLVLIGLGVTLAAAAIWARGVAPSIFQAPEFVSLIALAGLLLILGWAERVILLRAGGEVLASMAQPLAKGPASTPGSPE